MSRFIIIVLDSFGVGALPDAREFRDENANTLQHIEQHADHLNIPNMVSLGLYNIDGLELQGVKHPAGCYGKCAEKSKAKDTTNGHFEIAGLIVEKPYKVFGNAFPGRIIRRLEEEIGIQVIGNYPASGTEIIKVLGEEHIKTGFPIVYLSADSLMQIAMHEKVIPLERQYEICRTARKIMTGDDTVSRIICRPFAGEPGNFYRTENRKDFAVDPPGPTLLNILKEKGKDVIAVGKIEDIFNRSGITEINHTKNNKDGIKAAIEYIASDFNGLLFVNLVDFDMLYGHRNDPVGYAEALEFFDRELPQMTGALRQDDILVITADHGCDPTAPGTDHTREYTPLLVCGPNVREGINLGIRSTFADIGATAAEHLGCSLQAGCSFLSEIIKQ